MTETLQEYSDSRGLAMRVDGEAGMIRGVKILGVESRNGRVYPPETLARAARLYEDAKVNVNHPEGAPGGPRDYRDRIGTIRNVTARPGEGLFADFQFNPKHALAEQLVWDASHAPENVGFSHNVRARTRREGDRLVVEEISRVQSVDLVADPATTRGLFESADNVAEANHSTAGVPVAATAERPSLSVERLRADYPELVEEIVREQAAECERLRAELKEHQAAEALRRKRQLVVRLLSESPLPAPDAADPRTRAMVDDRFIEALMAAKDEPAMRELVRERVELIRGLGGFDPPEYSSAGRPVSRDQHLATVPSRLDAQGFVDAIT